MEVSLVEKALSDWHAAKYGRSEINIPKTMRKLGEEYGEFIEAVMLGNPSDIAEEAADVLFVMMHIVRQVGGVGALSLALDSKLLEIDRRLYLVGDKKA